MIPRSDIFLGQRVKLTLVNELYDGRQGEVIQRPSKETGEFNVRLDSTKVEVVRVKPYQVDAL